MENKNPKPRDMIEGKDIHLKGKHLDMHILSRFLII
jgi:hypothetical protein